MSNITLQPIKNKKNILIEFLAYSFFSVKKILLKGHYKCFYSDMLRFFKWWESRKVETDTIHVGAPWMVFAAVSFLKKWLKKDMKVFEYGSGGSTVFFSKLSDSIISVEHYEKWYNRVSKYISNNQINNIEYRLILPELYTAVTGSCTDPKSYKSCFPEFSNFSFKEYVISIDAYPDECFDLVVVDGRSRGSCILHAMKKVKVNGMLLVDNADRSYYLKPFPELFDKNKWGIASFIGHVPNNPPSEIDITILFTRKN